MENKSIAKKLKELRGRKSMAEVAEAIGVSKSTIAMYETGHRIPRDNIKRKLADFYNVSIEALFF